MITASVIHRVFRVRIDQTEGTAFTIEKDAREYLVTAKHVAETVRAGREIELFENAGWTPLQIELVGHSSGDGTHNNSCLAAPGQLNRSASA